MSKNRRKKLKKKRKKQRELLELQLSQVEGLSVDISTANGPMKSTSINGPKVSIIFFLFL